MRSQSGTAGVIKEEVWLDETDSVVKYNLAYINHMICSEDKGRVLGYDNAHGLHKRHFMGTREEVAFTTYQDRLHSFLMKCEVGGRGHEDGSYR